MTGLSSLLAAFMDNQQPPFFNRVIVPDAPEKLRPLVSRWFYKDVHLQAPVDLTPEDWAKLEAYVQLIKPAAPPILRAERPAAEAPPRKLTVDDIAVSIPISR